MRCSIMVIRPTDNGLILVRFQSSQPIRTGDIMKSKKTAKYLMDRFDVKSSKCPICRKKFRSDDCPHSIPQARERLFEDYVREIASQSK